MYVCTYVCTSTYVYVYLLLYHVRVTNITINEVDQSLISNVIEVRTHTYVLICITHSVTF